MIYAIVMLASCQTNVPTITKYFVIYYENHVDTIKVTGTRFDIRSKGMVTEIRRYPRSPDTCCGNYDVVIVTKGEIREIIWPE